MRSIHEIKLEPDEEGVKLKLPHLNITRVIYYSNKFKRKI